LALVCHRRIDTTDANTNTNANTTNTTAETTDRNAKNRRHTNKSQSSQHQRESKHEPNLVAPCRNNHQHQSTSQRQKLTGKQKTDAQSFDTDCGWRANYARLGAKTHGLSTGATS
jgi:hypothetical protein